MLSDSKTIDVSPVCLERMSVMGRSESRLRIWKKATSKIYRTVLFWLQSRYLLRRNAPTAKRRPGIAEAKSNKVANFNLSKPAGTRITEGAYREKKTEAKKRKIKYGLYGYGPMSLINLRNRLAIKRSSLIPYISTLQLS